jgi:hypothetical protein
MSNCALRTPVSASEALKVSDWVPARGPVPASAPPVTVAEGRLLSLSVSCAPKSSRLGFSPLPKVQLLDDAGIHGHKREGRGPRDLLGHEPPDPRRTDSDAAAGGNRHLRAVEAGRAHVSTLGSNPVAGSPAAAAPSVLRRAEHRPRARVAGAAGRRRTVVDHIGTRVGARCERERSDDGQDPSHGCEPRTPVPVLGSARHDGPTIHTLSARARRRFWRCRQGMGSPPRSARGRGSGR